MAEVPELEVLRRQFAEDLRTSPARGVRRMSGSLMDTPGGLVLNRRANVSDVLDVGDFSHRVGQAIDRDVLVARRP